jgi:hypothetical protein
VVGDQVTFTAAFASSQLMDYQWLAIKGGATNALAGATSPTLTLANLQLTNTATYQLRASNALGMALSTPASLTVSTLPAPVNNVLTIRASQTGLGSGTTFTPTWPVVTNNSLIAGRSPSSSSGNFSLEAVGRSVPALTGNNSLALTMITGSSGFPITCSTNYVTCGNGNGAGASLVYTLMGSATGFSLSNIVVYGGWADAGRDQQAYTVSCSRVAAPTIFTPLTSVNFNPANPASVQSATRVTLAPAAGVLATNVAALKFDFTSPTSENGYCGYAAIAVFGAPTIPPAVPARLSATLQAALGEFIMNAGSLVAGRNYIIQSTTNLASPWTDETNFVATQTTGSFTNPTANFDQKFYRIVGY